MCANNDWHLFLNLDALFYWNFQTLFLCVKVRHLLRDVHTVLVGLGRTVQVGNRLQNVVAVDGRDCLALLVRDFARYNLGHFLAFVGSDRPAARGSG